MEIEGRDRHDGELGRGEAPDGGLVEEREPSDNYGCEYSPVTVFVP